MINKILSGSSEVADKISPDSLEVLDEGSSDKLKVIGNFHPKEPRVSKGTCAVADNNAPLINIVSFGDTYANSLEGPYNPYQSY